MSNKMSPERLARYRALSTDNVLGISDEKISAYIERIVDEGYSLEADFFVFLRHHGFFQAPHTQGLNDVDIACVGVPMDQSTPMRGGTRLGPQAARKWSHIHGPVHEQWKTMPYDLCNIIEYGDIAFSGTGGETRCGDIYKVYKQFYERGIVPLSCGGEHTMTRPITIALGEDEPMGLVHIDAHADTGGTPAGMDSYNDNSVFREAVLAGAIDPERTIQIGIRGRAHIVWDFSHKTGMRVVSADEVHSNGIAAVVEEMQRIIGDGPVYLSIDTDGIDCIHMPGTTLPEPFGVTPLDVRSVIRGMRGMDIRGADIAELNPSGDPTEQSANIVAGLMFEMLCVLAEAKAERNGKPRMTHWR
ncbi:MAG: arginase family protein [Pseudomonadales bacterium]